MVGIRKAKKRDFGEIKKIYLKGLVDEFRTKFRNLKPNQIHKYINVKSMLEGIKKGINSKNEVLIVAPEKNKIVGFGHAKINKNKRGFIDKIYVLEKFRKKKHGTKLIEELIFFLKEKKVRQVRTNLLISNKPSLKLLTKFGFKELYSYRLMEK